MSPLIFIYLLSALIYFTQGVGSLASQPLFYYLKETLHMKVSDIMLLTSCVSIPWMVKPLYGFLSDNFPIFGYHRKSYILLSCLFSIVAATILGFTSLLPLYLLMALMVFDSLGGAIKDVAVDGLMVEEGKKHNLTGKIQAIQWGFLHVALILTGVGGGYIAEHFSYHTAYKAIIVFPLLIGICAYFYEEDCQKNETNRKSMWPKYKSLLKNKQFLLSTAFLFFMWFSPSVGTPIMAKMRDELHLSKMYIGWLSTIGSIAGCLGAVLYYFISRKIDLTRWLFWGTILNAISTIAYVYLTTTTVLVYAVLFGITGMFIQLLLMDFMARSCPKGTEATTFALLCSVVNFGGFLSGLTGSRLYDMLGYNGLVIISGVTTLACLAFIPFLKLKRS